MDPITAFTALSAVSSAASGIAGYSSAMSEGAQQDLNARLAETQTLQRDTAAREELLRSESATRAARGANNLSALSPNANVLFKERRRASDRDRLIQRADGKQTAQNYRTAAASSRRKARMSLVTGAINTGIPIAEYRMG